MKLSTIYTIYKYMDNNNLNEGLIPQNLKWRAGINDPSAKSSPFGDPGAAMAQAFVNGLNNKPPKVELPPIQKSKQDQYIDALLNNGVIWKTDDTDTRPETHDELIAQQNPQMICEPLNITIEDITLQTMYPTDITPQLIGKLPIFKM